MSHTNPVVRLPVSFGKLLAKLRTQRGLEMERLAAETGRISPERLASMERGAAEPSLTEFFLIAGALSESPSILLMDLIESWREDPTPGLPYRPRPGDFVRLYRLGCYELTAEFRELKKPYDSFNGAIAVSRALNTVRSRKAQPLLDHMTIYVRMGYVRFKPEDGTDERGTESNERRKADP